MSGAVGSLARALGVRHDEIGRVAALFALSFVLGLSLVSLEIALSTSLLLGLEARQLPWAQVVVAASVPVVGAALGWLRPRLSLKTFVTLPLSGVALTVLGLLLAHGDGAFGRPALLGLWASEHVLMAVALVGFWTVAARTFDLEQSRRIYGVISAGELVAGVLGGLIAAPLRHALPLPALLAMAVGGVFLSVLLTIPLAGRVAPEPVEAQPTAAFAGAVRGHAFRCIAYYGASNFTYDVIQFLVFVSIQRAYPGEPDRMAGVLGAVLSVRLTLSALLRLFVTGRLLARRGVGAALVSTPIAVGAIAVVALALHPLGFPLLAAAVTLQTAEATVRGGFGKPAFMAAQRPMPPFARERTLLLIETAVEPLTTGLAGAVLLLLPTEGLSRSTLLLLPVPSALAWAVIARSLDRSYRRLVATATTP